LRFWNAPIEGFYTVLETEHELGSALPFPWRGKHRDCKLNKTLTTIRKLSAPTAIERMSLSQRGWAGLSKGGSLKSSRGT
jgi:hypothetical protein